MVVYPKEEQESINSLLKEYPYSRIVVKPVRYKGKTYMAVDSSDLNLVEAIYCRYRQINEDPIIKAL